MRESRAYLNYFKQNRWYILTPMTVALGASVVYVLLLQPKLYQASALYEYSNSKLTISEMQVEVNQAVENMRSGVIENLLHLQNLSSLDVYKKGDLAIAVDITSLNKLSAQQDETSISQYITQKFAISQTGNWVTLSTKSNGSLIILISLLIGASIGLTASLLRSYLRNY